MCFGRSYMVHSSQMQHEYINEGGICTSEELIGWLWIWAPGVNGDDRNSKEQS